MKSYLNYGGGVNSTALILMMADRGVRFGPDKDMEIVFVDHGADWPETYGYVAMMSLRFPITILRPSVQGYSDLYAYLYKYRTLPFAIQNRICTDKFKVRTLNRYFRRPCFSLIGFSSDEDHRAALAVEKGIEKRYPLIEEGVNRVGCVEIIKSHGLPVPMKSGCWFCPFQSRRQFKVLRSRHPQIWCKVLRLERRSMAARIERGKLPMTLHSDGIPLPALVQENGTVRKILQKA